MAAALAQAMSVRALPDIAALMSEGLPEVSAFWVDEPTGELCKCRPDWVSPAGGGVSRCTEIAVDAGRAGHDPRSDLA